MPEDNLDGFEDISGSATEVANPMDKAEKSLEDRFNAPMVQAAADAREAQVLAKLGMDPEVQKVLQARSSGKKIRVVEDGEVQAQKELTSEEIDALPPSKMMQYVLNQLDARVEAKINGGLAPLKENFKSLAARTQEEEQKKILGEIERVKAKFVDFDTYAKSMVELSTHTQSALSVEELYLLSKRRAMAGKTPPKTQSERPNNGSIGQARTEEAVKDRSGEVKASTGIRGRASFSDILDRSIKGLQLKSSETLED